MAVRKQFEQRLGEFMIRLLRPLLHGRKRMVALTLLVVVNIVLGFFYARIGDNNSMLGMMQPRNASEAVYLREFIDGYGIDDYIFAALVVEDAFSPESRTALGHLSKALQEVKIPIHVVHPPRCDEQGVCQASGVAQWAQIEHASTTHQSRSTRSPSSWRTDCVCRDNLTSGVNPFHP